MIFLYQRLVTAKPICFLLHNFLNHGRRLLLWHTLLVMVASAVDHVQLSALYLLFLREILSSLSTLTHASTADHAQLSALYQPSLRVENKQRKSKRAVLSLLNEPLFFILSKLVTSFKVRRLCILRKP